MHLPENIRRRVLYATAATLLVGGLTFTIRAGQLKNAPSPAASLASAPQDAADAPATPDPAAAAAAPEAQEAQPKPKVSTYTVVEGDTVEGIAAKFGLKSETVLWSNDLSEHDFLQIGQELKIPAIDGIVYTVQTDDTVWGISTEYGIDFTEIVAANSDVEADALQPGDVLLLPGAQPVAKRLSTMVASRGVERTVAKAGHFSRWPTSGVITDYFGWRTHPVYGTRHFHDGMDIGVPIGTSVASVAGGHVTYVGYLGGYGLTVKVDHGDGVVSMYAHLSQATVSVGEDVAGGEQIALSGNTGTSTGPHLHFTVLIGGSPVDPAGWLP